jgi:hypothetical protein
MEEKINIFRKISSSLNNYLVASSKLSFYYILPFGLGLITSLSIRDSYLLTYKKRLSMALASYYESTGEIIHQEILNDFPKLEKVIERGKNFEKNKQNEEAKSQ